MYTIYAITTNGKQGDKQENYWNPVGVGFKPNQDGSINFKLHMFPDLKLQIREKRSDAAEESTSGSRR